MKKIISIPSIFSIVTILPFVFVGSVCSVNASKTITADLYDLVTLHPKITNIYSNPFDSDEIKVDAEIISPSGKIWTVPGFYIQPYTGKIINGKEVIKKSGKPEWQVRLSFNEPGKHKIRITAKDKNGIRTLKKATIRVTDHRLPRHIQNPQNSTPLGFIHRSKTDYRYFVDDSGKTFFLLGANVCWAYPDKRGVFAYDTWIKRYAEQQCNYFRVWLSPAWCDFALRSYDSGFYKFDQRNAWKIDYVLNLAKKFNMRVMFAIDSYNIICTNKKSYGMFDKSPCNIKNGGPVKKPIDYFTNSKVKKANYNRLRYLVARYGYSPNVFAWEFWNEVDGSDAFRSKNGPKIITDWHRDSARYLRKLDPWHHLITTSFANEDGFKNIEKLPEIDLIQVHHYNSDDLIASLEPLWEQRRNDYKKPFFNGEFGYSTMGLNKDPKGVHLHNALFASVGGLCAGTPMIWFWDSYIEPNNLYYIYGSFANWISGFDFIKQQVKPIEVEFKYIKSKEKHKREDLVISRFKSSWTSSDFNKPTTIKVPSDGTFNSRKFIAMFIHGSNHANFYNPQTFVLNVTKPTKFIIEIGKVSGWGGAVMEVYLDKKLVLKKNFIDPDGLNGKENLQQYASEYVVNLPLGKHKLTIKNTGTDWFEIKKYFIPMYTYTKKPFLFASGVIGKDKALIWIQSPYYVWSKVYNENYKPYIYKNVCLIVKNLEPGDWTVEEFNTQSGKVISAKKYDVGHKGKLKITMPEIKQDIAYRLIRQ